MSTFWELAGLIDESGEMQAHFGGAALFGFLPVLTLPRHSVQPTRRIIAGSGGVFGSPAWCTPLLLLGVTLSRVSS